MAEDDGKHGDGVWPRESEVGRWTDTYFNRTRTTVQAFGDVEVTYAVFMRRPVVFAPRLMIGWLEAMATARGSKFRIEPQFFRQAAVMAGDRFFAQQLRQAVSDAFGHSALSVGNAFHPVWRDRGELEWERLPDADPADCPGPELILHRSGSGAEDR